MKETTIIWSDQFQSEEEGPQWERIQQEVENWLKDELSR